jgi:hypothetical protein
MRVGPSGLAATLLARVVHPGGVEVWQAALEDALPRSDVDAVDLIYAVAEAIYRFMESGPALPLAFVYIALAAIPVTLLHEFGHAFAAKRLLETQVQVSVGSAGKIAELRLGQITASINALSVPGRVAGTAAFDASRATAKDVVSIAVAGPFASFAGTIVTAGLLASAPAAGIAHDFLWAAVGSGVFGVLNLVPLEFQERRGGPRVRTDGRLAIDALRVALALR